MLRSCAFSPGHITGFFSPFRSGSVGAGISLDRGMITRIEIRPYHRPRFEVVINGMRNDARTSIEVLKAYTEIFGPFEARVEHSSSLPVGFGFGMSGAGALSLSIALDEAFGSCLKREEVVRIAHDAEIRARTGLGTVVSEALGGFELRLRPGGPGEGRLIRIPVKRGYSIVASGIRPINTDNALMDRSLSKMARELGGRMVERLIDKPDLDVFMDLSSRFSRMLMPHYHKMDLLIELRRLGYRPSLAMLGITPFVITKGSEAYEVSRIFARYGLEPLVMEMDERGARPI